MESLGHEKLRVYQHGLRFISWGHELLSEMEGKAAVLDQFDRASESILENIANGNSRRGQADRNRYFDIALGSGLECAACLDILSAKKLVSVEKQREGKAQLQSIVRMMIRLREVPSGSVRDEEEEYDAVESPAFFPHERLDVYQVALELVCWLDGVLSRRELGARYASRLDESSTSIVLNIAEGNGRFASLDHRRFVDISYTGAMRVASMLDMIVVRGLASEKEVQGGKDLLVRLVPLLLGLRGYLDDCESAS